MVVESATKEKIKVGENWSSTTRSAAEDPKQHLRIFLEIADTVKIHGVAEDTIRLRLFPFSLRDNARSWIQSLPLGNITWEDMASKFLTKYFPPTKSAQLKIEITTFHQQDSEQLYEAWEHYKELLRRCPTHNFKDWKKIELFYNGLNGPTRMSVSAAARGSVFSKYSKEAYDILEQMTINSYQWPSKEIQFKKPAGIYEVYAFTALYAQMAAIYSQIATMNKGNQMVETAAVATIMNSIELEGTVEQVQYANNKNFSGYRGNPPPNHYHPGLRNHEKFSYANNNNVLNPPPRFNNQMGEGKPSLEDLVSTFVTESSKRLDRSESRLDNLETHVTNMGATMKSLEMQIGQIASAINNHWSSHQRFESGKEGCGSRDTKLSIKKRPQDKIIYIERNTRYSHMPFPQRFQKRGLDAQFSKFLEVSKKIHINIPFAEALERMPSYAMIMKEILSKKKKFVDFENVTLTEECSAIIQKNLPQKPKDPGSFKIPCAIGGQFVGSALCDVGESVNLMPISVYKKLGLTEMNPTRVMLHLADRSVNSPCELVEDVLVKLDKLLLPADFFVLVIEEDHHVPIILGRPFLADSRVLLCRMKHFGWKGSQRRQDNYEVIMEHKGNKYGGGKCNKGENKIWRKLGQHDQCAHAEKQCPCTVVA
ncbi:uncharacterized protein [Henckelia pumila]|uniref:uncharacterized protein n=1 Tax=Henckelia pumila TaxID=405737 RepID=UPI003C6E1AA2